MSVNVPSPLFRYTRHAVQNDAQPVVLKVGRIRSAKPSLLMSPHTGLPNVSVGVLFGIAVSVTSVNCAAESEPIIPTSPAAKLRMREALRVNFIERFLPM